MLTCKNGCERPVAKGSDLCAPCAARSSSHAFAVGERVHDVVWGHGTVTSLRSPGVVAVKFDGKGTLHLTETCLTRPTQSSSQEKP